MLWKVPCRACLHAGNELTQASRFHSRPQLRALAHAVDRFRISPQRVTNQMGNHTDYSQGRLYARPGQTSLDDSAPPCGLQPLGTGARRDGLIYTPRSYRHGQPSPLCIMMHGAGGNAKGALFPPLEELAEKVHYSKRLGQSCPCILLSPCHCQLMSVVITERHGSGVPTISIQLMGRDPWWLRQRC